MCCRYITIIIYSSMLTTISMKICMRLESLIFKFSYIAWNYNDRRKELGYSGRKFYFTRLIKLITSYLNLYENNLQFLYKRSFYFDTIWYLCVSLYDAFHLKEWDWLKIKAGMFSQSTINKIKYSFDSYKYLNSIEFS